MSKAVIYARYSCDNQREESIEGQIRECKAYALRMGFTVVGIYIDRALTAKNDNRPDFQKMIKDSAKEVFDIVIVWKLDRFARNRYDSAHYKKILKKNNVKVVSATEVISEGAEGIILESLLEGLAEYYSADLSEKVSRGMTENALNGKFNGGVITFGYRVGKSRNFVKDPVNASIVTDIFNRYAMGEPIRSIVDDLNARGVTNNGKSLSYHFVNWLLKNRRYLGEYRFGDVVNSTAFPQLVTPEIFDRCQARLYANKHRPAVFRNVDDKYLLTGKLFCGLCGDTMSGMSGTSKDKTRDLYRYYQCMTSKKKTCKKKMIKKSLVENLVLRATMEIFEDEDLVDRITDVCFSLQNDKGTQLPLLKKQLKQKKKEIDNIMSAVKAGIITKSTKFELEKLEREQENLEALIVKEEIARPIISKEQIKAWIMRFSKTDLEDENQKIRLIDAFVNSVYVYEDKIVVFLNYKNGEKSIPLDEVSQIIKKENTRKSECSSLFVSGDPYGN